MSSSSLNISYAGVLHQSIPTALVVDPILKSIDFRVWAVIQSFSSHGQQVEPSLLHICAKVGAAKETVNGAIQRLRLTRWLTSTRQRHAENRWVLTSEYQLHDAPMPLATTALFDPYYADFVKQQACHAKRYTRAVALGIWITLCTEEMREISDYEAKQMQAQYQKMVLDWIAHSGPNRFDGFQPLSEYYPINPRLFPYYSHDSKKTIQRLIENHAFLHGLLCEACSNRRIQLSHTVTESDAQGLGRSAQSLSDIADSDASGLVRHANSDQGGSVQHADSVHPDLVRHADSDENHLVRNANLDEQSSVRHANPDDKLLFSGSVRHANSLQSSCSSGCSTSSNKNLSFKNTTTNKDYAPDLKFPDELSEGQIRLVCQKLRTIDEKFHQQILAEAAAAIRAKQSTEKPIAQPVGYIIGLIQSVKDDVFEFSTRGQSMLSYWKVERAAAEPEFKLDDEQRKHLGLSDNPTREECIAALKAHTFRGRSM